jgi:hypothetical protein
VSTRLLTMSPAEFEQITCDLEGTIEELEMLSEDVDWYVTDLPDRLRICLEILTRGQDK